MSEIDGKFKAIQLLPSPCIISSLSKAVLSLTGQGLLFTITKYFDLKRLNILVSQKVALLQGWKKFDILGSMPRTTKSQWKTISMENDLNGRRHQWKTTSMEDNLNGRHSQLKTTAMEDDLNRRRTQWKTTSMEDNLNRRQDKWKKTLMEGGINGEKIQ